MSQKFANFFLTNVNCVKSFCLIKADFKAEIFLRYPFNPNLSP